MLRFVIYSPPVDDLEVPELNKVGVLGIPDGDNGVHLLYQLLTLLLLEVNVPEHHTVDTQACTHYMWIPTTWPAWSCQLCSGS